VADWVSEKLLFSSLKKACHNDSKVPAVNVRYAPESDRLLHRREMTRWANNDISHRRKSVSLFVDHHK
jgi:hypothetical protein